MIIEFTVRNFLSFFEKRTINFEAKGISELKENIVSIKPYKLMRSAVIYGANSSGKSNLLKALDRMRDTVLNSVKLNDSDELDYTPFLLMEGSEDTPTFFEIIFLFDNKRFRYGFEYNLTEIINEWLFVGKSAKSENPLFIRTKEGIGVSERFEEGKDKEDFLKNENRLFISLVAQLGGDTSKQIVELFRNYNVISGLNHKSYNGFSLRMLHKKLDGCTEALSLFQTLKLGFKELLVTESEFDPLELPKSLPSNVKSSLTKELSGKKVVTLNATHYMYDKKGNVIDTVSWDKNDNESEGTNKIIDLSGPIFDTLILGNILMIDELDAKLHPLITIHIIKLFNNPKTNPNNAQLLFATHDTNLLDADLFRRDQIWFAEKDELEQTDLYSLYDINLPDGTKVRNDSNLEKNYIRGRYGAIPYITT